MDLTLRTPAMMSMLSLVVLGTFSGPLDPVALDASDPPSTVASTTNHVHALQGTVLNRIQSTGWRNSDWGVLAVSLQNGDTLAAFNPDLELAPASNQKLFTSAAALHHLGPEFRFPTFLLTDGTVEDGVLYGDLILYGTGDPAMSDRLLEGPEAPLVEFAHALRKAGIHTITGAVIGDGSYFHGPSRAPTWRTSYLNDWYAAPVSALTFNENVVTLRIRAGSPGRPSVVSTIPEGAALPLVNQSTSVSGNARSPLLLVRDHPDDPIELRGSMRSGSGEIWRVLTVADPPAYAASVFQRVLEKEGIRVEGGARALGVTERSRVSGRQLVAPAFQAEDSSSLRTVAMHQSPPVHALLDVVNKRSHNLYSELLLFMVGKVTRGDGSFAGGNRALTDFIVRVVGVPESHVHIEDGSGLSPANRATANAFVSLLKHVSESEYTDAFWASLPEAGNQRELSRMHRSSAAGNLRAKTGTISRVSALSGIVRTANGEPVLFSILSNNVPSSGIAKRIEDQIGIQLASFSRTWPPSPGNVEVAQTDIP